MKAGIVTIYDVPNFGSVLQAYATKQVLTSLGYTPIFIEYNRHNKWRIDHGGAPKSPWYRSFIRKLGLKADHRKAIKLEDFKKQHFKRTRIFNDLDDLNSQDWSDYAVFVVGSDQVWNTNYLKGDSFFLLSFIPEYIKKISIASSFAIKHLPLHYEKKFKKYLSQFRAISVREINGQKIIKEQLELDVDVKLMLDPTLLLSSQEWTSLLPFTLKYNEPYILFYMWAYAFEPRPYIYEVTKYYQEKLQCKVIALEGCYPTCPSTLKMENHSDSNIPKFLQLFSNASLVITSSFHGTAFAVNYGRPLISIIPEGGDDRQTSLLENLGIPQCAVRIGTDLESINPYYNSEQEQHRLNELRENSILWIKNNIN